MSIRQILEREYNRILKLRDSAVSEKESKEYMWESSGINKALIALVKAGINVDKQSKR